MPNPIFSKTPSKFIHVTLFNRPDSELVRDGIVSFYESYSSGISSVHIVNEDNEIIFISDSVVSLQIINE